MLVVFALVFALLLAGGQQGMKELRTAYIGFPGIEKKSAATTACSDCSVSGSGLVVKDGMECKVFFIGISMGTVLEGSICRVLADHR